VLSYEKAVRKEAARRMNQEGVAFPVALRAAWRDPLTKERHFTTPLALVAKRPSNTGGQPDGHTKKQKFNAKGTRDKGKGKGQATSRLRVAHKGGDPHLLPL